jgi:hypothetical protein
MRLVVAMAAMLFMLILQLLLPTMERLPEAVVEEVAEDVALELNQGLQNKEAQQSSFMVAAAEAAEQDIMLDLGLLAAKILQLTVRQGAVDRLLVAEAEVPEQQITHHMVGQEGQGDLEADKALTVTVEAQEMVGLGLLLIL